MMPEVIDLATARRMALAAQGFASPRPSGRVDIRHLRRVIGQIGVLQVDSVNVLCRSHYLPLFARIGPYSRDVLDQMAWGGRRELFEYFWGQKAALLPFSAYPLLRWRMRAAAEQTWGGRLDRDTQVPSAVAEGMSRLAKERPGLVDEVFATIAARGPIAARDIDERSVRGPVAEGGRMWNWQDTKIAVELLFSAGRVAVAERRNFERLYDLAERVFPDELVAGPAMNADAAQRDLVRIAARALGIATAAELCAPKRSYIALPPGAGKARVAELVEAGELVPVRIGGLRDQFYVWPGAAQPERVEAHALLSPFDSLIWNRERTERFFGFRYRISIYTPESQRVHGYYVLPFLLGEKLVARVDVQADRRQRTLRVPVVNLEPGAEAGPVAEALAAELRLMAAWLELDQVVAGGRGDLAAGLARSLCA